MTILSPISWARQNVAVLVGAIVFGVVQFVLTLVKLNYLLGLSGALAFALALWAIAAFHAITGSTQPPAPQPAPPVTASNR